MSRYTDTIETIHISAVDAASGEYDPYEQKSILAMQTMHALVNGTEDYTDLNEELHGAAETIGTPPAVTYEDLIFSNDLFGAARVMSEEAHPAEHEAKFYRAHRVIETDFHLAVRKLLSHGDNASICSEAIGFSVEPLEYSEEDVSPTKHVDIALGGLKNLRAGLRDPETFNAFRVYFAEKLNGYAGPSGLYSATIPVLDLMTTGQRKNPDKVKNFMLDGVNNGLYPQRIGYDRLMKHLLETDAPEMEMPDEEREGINAALNRFRIAHSGAVKNLLPKVHDGTYPGSGGIENFKELQEAKMISEQPVND